MEPIINNKEGWICPKCQAVMSPKAPTCFYCKPIPKPFKGDFCDFNVKDFNITIT